MGKLSWHVDSPPPFAFVTPDQQVRPFGRSQRTKHINPQPPCSPVQVIPGSKPKTHCFATPPRLTNPLEPHYPLPHHNHPQPTAPVLKFIKNPLDNSDIPGAQASPRIKSQRQHPNFRLDCSDVDGAAPGWQPDWKQAAKARHAQLRPATAPCQKHTERAVRPSNYVRDIERSSPWHPTNADAHQSKVQAADAATSSHVAAQQLLQQKVGSADDGIVAALWHQFRQYDHEASGKLTTSEFARVLQTSKLGFSNAEVLRVANGMADCHGLMDYRRLTHTLQSQGLHSPRPQSASCDGFGAKKPPLARSSSHARTPRSSGEAGQTAKHAQHAAMQAQQRASELVSPAAVEAVADDKHGGSSSAKHVPTLSESAQQQQLPQQQAAASASEATLQQLERRDDADSCQAVAASPGHSAAAPGPSAEASAKDAVPSLRSFGPPAQKVAYFFSKGQVNMEQPYRWQPSKDDTMVVGSGSKGQFVRPWTAGHAADRPAQMGQSQTEREAVSASSDALTKLKPVFYDDSRQYQRPVQVAAAVDVSHRDSPMVRRQKGCLLEDMMTIKRL